MITNPTIAISGVATSGKDTFGRLLIEELSKLGYKAKRFALADQLKKDLARFILERYNINIFDCTLEQKTLIRPLMVFHGEIMRNSSQGTYWINLLDQEIKQEQEKDAALIPIITDIRYAFYPNDELFWVQKEKHGLVIHVERYVLLEGNTYPSEITPANEVEAKHNGALKEKCDYSVKWLTSPDILNIDSWCRLDVIKFIESNLMKNFLDKCLKQTTI